MARAIGFPAIGVWDDWRGEIFPSFAKRKPSPSAEGDGDEGKATGMNAS